MWEVILSFSVAFLILELIIPNVIYLNLAIASIITAATTFFITNGLILAGVFVLSLISSIFVIRPKVVFFEKQRKQQKKVKAEYIGKIAQIVETTNKNSGILTIDNQRWQARTKNNEIIEQGQNAKITNYKDIVMYVEKV